jgi:tetraacyldisaccharide 4'-kinase
MLEFDPPLPVIMTEKDAVKCRTLHKKGCWALRVDAQLDAGFETQFLQRLAQVSAQHTGQHNGSETA